MDDNVRIEFNEQQQCFHVAWSIEKSNATLGWKVIATGITSKQAESFIMKIDKGNKLKLIDVIAEWGKLNIIPVHPMPYKFKKVPCHCPCHRDKNVKHSHPCCDNGYIEVPEHLHTTRRPPRNRGNEGKPQCI